MRPATAPRLLTVVAVLVMVAAGIGFITTLILNAFVLDRYDAYGEVPIPGRAELQLPAGEVNISFHTQIIGSAGGAGLPIPDMRMAIDPPAGVPEPEVVENIGGTTSVNSDARVRVWVAKVAEAGTYTVRTDGDVTAFVSPRLAFGHGSPLGHAPWWCAAVFGLGLIDLVIARVWAARSRARSRSISPTFTLGEVPATHISTENFPTGKIPTEDGIRLENLKTLAALRESGALTEAEFESEKRRLLGG